ncbi:MAG TPA: type I-E CRISPR-associated protein Cse2/CasB [Syntrophobacteraceae bacterium]|nr:type I-E CRISPR-associated protein Cse2/CasB [Syntrophobacteraceae bacterium]
MSRLTERLRRFKDDRGIMANLRCIYVDSKKHRAWPALNRLGVPINDGVSAFIAGLYATHPEETATGNFGHTCKAIERHRDESRPDDSKLSATERRFQHLLTAETDAELHNRVLRMVLMARSQGVPVNYAKLETDLRIWKLSDRVKIDWASAFWAPEALSAEEEV